MKILVVRFFRHHFKVRDAITISDSKGKLLDTIDVPLSTSSIVPNMSRQLKTEFIPKSEFPAGVYSVASKITLADGTVLDEAKGSFTVGASGFKPAVTSPTSTAEPTPPTTDTLTPTPTPAPTPQPGGVPMSLFIGVLVGAVVVIAVLLVVLGRRHVKA